MERHIEKFDFELLLKVKLERSDLGNYGVEIQYDNYKIKGIFHKEDVLDLKDKMESLLKSEKWI